MSKSAMARFHEPSPSKDDKAGGLQTENEGLKSITHTLAGNSEARLISSYQNASNEFLAMVEAAWAIVLSVYTGNNDISFKSLNLATTADCKKGWRLRECDIQGDLNVVQLLDHLRHQTRSLVDAVDGHGSQTKLDSPLTTLWGQSGTGLILHDTDEVLQPELGGSCQADANDKHWSTKFDVVLHVYKSADELVTTLEYAASLVLEPSARSVAACFAETLASIVKESNVLVRDIRILPISEQAELLSRKKTPTAATERCLHDLLEDQVKIRPSTTAIQSSTKALSYAQLLDYSSRLAHQLLLRGVKREVMVPFCFEKSPIAIIAMIAILKAGGACVVLDPSQPMDRLDTIIREVSATTIVTSKNQLERMGGKAENVLAVDWEYLDGLQIQSTPITSVVTPRNAAFVMFTSGSTGIPKGIVLEHRSLSTSVLANAPTLRIDETTRALQFASYAFDVSLEEIFTPLSQGGCVCSPSDSERQNGLVKFMTANRVTWADMTPTVASTLLNPQDVPTLQTLVLGGEALNRKIVQSWAPHVHLVAMYGPAECSINCVGNGKIGCDSDFSNLGSGLAAALWVVDPRNDQMLCPVGAVGELLVEGAILARGYLNEPEKTAAAFIESPDWLKSKEYGSKRRLYKTGDLVRLQPNDGLSFVGRKDSQFKLRGQRVEISEIQSHLRAIIPPFWQAVVEVANLRSHPSLVVYLCDSPAVTVTTNSTVARPPINHSQALTEACKYISSILSQKIPSYMMPSAYIGIAWMPTLTSGKVDRRMLRKITEDLTQQDLDKISKGSQSVIKVQATTELETRLERLWKDCLNMDVDSIGVNDNFFEIGGDSLLAMKLVAASNALKIPLNMQLIYQWPTIQQMANNLRLQPFSQVNGSQNGDDDDEFGTPSGSHSEEDYRVVAEQCQVRRSDLVDLYACTPLQESLIALSTKLPGSYVGQFLFELPADLDFRAYQSAWTRLVMANPIMRTRIVLYQGRSLLQAVLKNAPNWVYTSDLEGYLEQDRNNHMHLGSSLSRLAVVTDDGKPSHVVWTAHHAIYDGYSLELMLQQIEQLYEGRTISSPTSYKRFVRESKTQNSHESGLFWKSYLAGALPFRIFRPQQPGHEFQLGRLPSKIIPINEMLGQSTTISTMIRGAWAITLAQHSKTSDVVFGAVLSGRSISIPGIEGIVGPTMVTVPVRIQLDLDKTAENFLRMVQADAVRAMPYEHYGLPKIKKSISNASVCDFETLLVIQPHRLAGTSTNDCLPKPIVVDEADRSTFPLTVECTLLPGAIQVETHFDVGLIGVENLEEITSSFADLIQALAQSQYQPLRQITNFDHARARVRSNTHHSIPCPPKIERCVHELFEEQTAKDPQAPAVDSSEISRPITYLELDRAANNIAAKLRELGVGPEALVPFCFEKSPWVVAALLGVLKAGGATVPLDPAYPQQRANDIISNAAANVIITQREFQGRFREVVKHVLILDGAAIASLPPAPKITSRSVKPSNPAYVLFTSGSTGKPKGIIIEHAAFATSAHYHGPALAITRHSRVLQFAAYTYDVSVGEIFTTLLQGGCICVPSEHSRLNDLAGAIKDMRVNWAFLTPTVAGTLSPLDVPGLKTLVLGGEHATRNNFTTWAPHVNLINSYGPAECAIWTNRASRAGVESSPDNIGHAVGCKIYIAARDNHNKLVSHGSVGELLVESHGLAREYLNEPTKTSDAFITNPSWIDISPGQSRRLYKSGDLAKFNEDGTISIIGRKDKQVKIRGQRVELGEIEHHLSANPAIRHAAVLFPSSGPFKGRLVAVLSLAMTHASRGINEIVLLSKAEESSVRILIKKLRGELQSLLPNYMVPETWAFVEHMPLTLSGKIGRAPLAAWLDSIDHDSYERIMALARNHASGTPDNPTEESLLRIWSEVLNVPAEQIGMHTPFLRVGGDSITAMQVSWKSKKSGLSLSVQDIVASESLRHLAARVSTPQKTTIPKEQHDVLFALSPIQKLFFRLNKNISYNELSHYNQSFFVKITQQVPFARIKTAVNTLVQAHSMLRARFVHQANGLPQQMVSSDSKGSYRCIEHVVADLDSVTPIANASQKSLNIENGPLISFDSFQTHSGQFLFAVAHHLVIDLVSWRIIFQELEELLGSQPYSPSRGLSFQAWCTGQRDYALKNLSPSSVLPSAVPEPDFEFWGMRNQRNTNEAVHEINFKLPMETTSHLLGYNGKDSDVETMDLFNAAVLYSFARSFPDRGPPSLFNEGHGREAWDPTLDPSSCVGWFTTIFPIHASVQGTSSIMQTCHAVAQFRRGLSKKGWGYFTSRFLNPEGIEVFGNHTAEILLNFFGQYQQFERPGTLFQQADAALYRNDVGETISRQALVDVWINVERGHLHVSMIFNRNMRHQDRILNWAEALKQNLLQIATIISDESPSDFKDNILHPTLASAEAQLVTRDSLRVLGVQDLSVVEDEYPCSPTQEAILSRQDLNPELYQVQSIWKMSSKYGHLEKDRVQRAWQSVVVAHPGLRTIIVPDPTGYGSHLQVILRESKFLDLQHLLPYKFRVTAAAKQGEFTLSLDITHALIDGASISILREDLALAYDGMLVTENRASYHSFIEHLQSKPPNAAQDYWKAYLSGVTPCHFPAKRSENRQNDTLQTQILEINNIADIRDFLQDHGYTLTTFFQFIWGMVLSRQTGTDDVCFGYLVSGRDYSIDAVERIVGPFIHMLPCRMSTSSETTALNKLKDLQSEFFQALENQECSLSAMYQGLDLGGEPLFNTAISIQKATSEADRRIGTTTVEEIGGNDPTEYDIAVNIEEQEDKIEIIFAYWAENVSRPSIIDVASSFKQVISLVLDNVHTTTKYMRPLGSETQNSLALWNRNVPSTVDRCVHAIIHDQRLRAPLAPAICSSGETISYEQLDILSSRLAASIQQIPFGPDKLVALAIEKSPLTIIAMLAVLKAGGGFIPLDIEHPSARIESIISTSRAGLVLTTEEYANQMSLRGIRTQIVSRELLDNLPDGKISSHCTNSSRTAYVIFTSGSTGTPKGVVIPHSALSTGAQTHGQGLQIRSDSRVLQFASYSFDACIVEIMTTLLQGGCVCVPTSAERLDFVSFMKKTEVNLAVLTPSLIRAIHPDEVPMLKTLVLAGEAMNQEVLSQWAPRLQLINGYGPSECCVCCAFSEMNAKADPRDIGRATGCRLWVVDANNHDILVPLGCVGELAVEGPILAQGYLNDPQKTALAFVENAAWFDEIALDSPPRRIYKTGDLVRYNIDGTLRFVGRKDTQVKIRGQRVELGEVEQALSRECVATDSVATISQNDCCKDRLVAILRFQDIPAVTNVDKRPLSLASAYVQEARARIAEAKDSMSRKVPLYMMPDVWIAVGSLPLLPSGKVDRPSVSKWLDSLSQEELDRFALAEEATDKSSTRFLDEMENYLLTVLKRIIDRPLEARDLEKSFVALGGDSISAMRLLSICKKDGYLLELHDVFNTQHVVELAKSFTKLNNGKAATGGNDTIDAVHYKARNPGSSATHAKSSTIFPCSATQDSMLKSQSDESTYYTTQFIWEFIDSSEDLDLNRVLSAWQNVVDRHPILRCIFLKPKTSKDCYHQSIIERLPARSSILSSEATNVLQTLRDVPQLNYEDGSAQHRLLLIYSSPSSAFCRLEMSHAITDGTSMSVIIADLINAYERRLTGIAPSFETYINHIGPNKAQTHIEYWENYIGGMTPCHLPGLTPQKPLAELRTLEFQACDETRATEFCTSHGVTLSNLVSLTWAITLSTLLVTDDVNYAYITSSRNVDIDGIEQLVGPLINSLPCNLHLLGTMTVQEALRIVQQDFFNSSQHQNFLPREVSPFYSADGTRPFNTLVNFRNFHTVDVKSSATKSSLKVVEHFSADPMDYDVVLGGHVEDGKLILALSTWVEDGNDAAKAQLKKLVKQIIEHMLDGRFESIDALRNEVSVD